MGQPLIGPTLNLRSRTAATKRGSEPKQCGFTQNRADGRPHWQPPFLGGWGWWAAHVNGGNKCAQMFDKSNKRSDGGERRTGGRGKTANNKYIWNNRLIGPSPRVVLSDFIFSHFLSRKEKLAVAYAIQLENGNGKLAERWETFWAQEIDYYLWLQASLPPQLPIWPSTNVRIGVQSSGVVSQKNKGQRCILKIQ